MTRPTLRPEDPEILVREAERRSQLALDRMQRRRDRALKVLVDFPAGAGPMPGLDENDLRSLVARGLAERVYVLTQAGRRRASELEEAGQ